MKKAIVTGGSGLIGTGVCKALLANGWEVASFDLKPGEGEARHIDCDLGDEDSVKQAFETLGWSSLDLLVNKTVVAQGEVVLQPLILVDEHVAAAKARDQKGRAGLERLVTDDGLTVGVGLLERVGARQRGGEALHHFMKIHRCSYLLLRH